MRRRLVILLLPVIALLMIGIIVFVGVLVADRRTQAAHVDRMGDATRFAAILTDAIDTGGDLSRVSAELAEYTALYDSPVWVLGLDGTLLHDPGVPLPGSAEIRDVIAQAYAGARLGNAATIWPWQQRDLLVVEPVGRDSQVVAVVVIQAPTDRLRADTWRDWATWSVILLIPVGGLVLGLWPVTRWMLRPVRDLEDVAEQISSGDLDARADAERGPPELRELATGFNGMVQAVQRSLQRQRDFVDDAAHQLRNPLASLQLTVESMRPWLQDPAAQEAYTDAMAESARMSEMFEAMLASTALTGAEPVADEQARPLAEILQKSAGRWQEMLDGAGMSLQLKEVPASVRVREPAGGLAGAIDELVTNAARLSGGSTLRISAELVSGGSGADSSPVSAGTRGALIRVVDNGVGLPPEALTAATGRFWRADQHQNVPGTGLGLAILNDIVSDAGGEFSLHAAPGGGLDVSIVLPLVTGPAPA